MNESFNFNSEDVLERVLSHCNEIPDTAEQIDYLEWVLKEHKQWRRSEGLAGKTAPINLREAQINKGLIQRKALSELHRRIAKNIETEIKYKKSLLKRQSDTSSKNLHKSNEQVTYSLEHTTARQVLAIHYLMKYCKTSQASNADVARFIEFLTSKNYKNIYKRVCNPLGSRDKELNEDLRFVRAFFEKLGLSEIVRMINNEINDSSF